MKRVDRAWSDSIVDEQVVSVVLRVGSVVL